MNQKDKFNNVFKCDFNFDKLDTIVFSGGALKCLYFIGAAAAIYDNSNSLKIKNYAGTSSGAFISILLAVGYHPFEILKRLIKSREVLIFSTLTKTIEDVGEMLIEKGFTKDVTFREIEEKTGSRLAFVTCNASKMREEIFSSMSHPDTPVLIAAKLSSSLPIIFMPSKYNGDIYTDGIFCDNFPLKLAKRFGDVNKVVGITTRTSTYDKNIKEFYRDNDLYKIILIDDSLKKWFFISRDEKFRMFTSGYNFVSDRIFLTNKSFTTKKRCESL